MRPHRTSAARSPRGRSRKGRGRWAAVLGPNTARRRFMAPDFRREEADRHHSLAANRTALYEGRRIAHGPETSSRPVWFPPRQLRAAAAMRGIPVLAVFAVFAALSGNVHAQDATQITVQTARVRQVFEG